MRPREQEFELILAPELVILATTLPACWLLGRMKVVVVSFVALLE